MQFVGKWIKLKSTILSKATQTQKDICAACYCRSCFPIFSYLQQLKKPEKMKGDMKLLGRLEREIVGHRYYEMGNEKYGGI